MQALRQPKKILRKSVKQEYMDAYTYRIKEKVKY